MKRGGTFNPLTRLEKSEENFIFYMSAGSVDCKNYNRVRGSPLLWHRPRDSLQEEHVGVRSCVHDHRTMINHALGGFDSI